MKPLILITNDDGIFSPGLFALAEVLADLGDLLVVAPAFQQTSMGRSFPKGEEIGIIKEVDLALPSGNIKAYSVCGSPAQAVSYGLLELTEKTPELCVSGINYGENVGNTLTCSGTVGACFEAVNHGIPSVALSRQADLEIQSLSDYRKMDWSISKKVAAFIVGKILKQGFPENAAILNVNVPDQVNSDEIRLTSQSRHSYGGYIKPGKRDFNKGYQLISKFNVDFEALEKGSDMYSFYKDKVVTLTPIKYDFSTTIDWSAQGKIRFQ